jgi:hypothetical protein
MLAHELTHIRQGAPERAAFDEQLRVLRALKARRADIQQAEQAQDYIRRSDPRRY